MWSLKMNGPYVKQEGSVYVFCQQPKLVDWVVSHILLVTGGIFLIFSLLDGLIEGRVFFRRDLIVTTFMFGIACFFRILWRNMCSRVEIDTIAEKIKFFRFYKETVEAPVRSVKFRFTWIFTCFYAGEKFIIPGGYINAIAEVLPAGVEIEFGKSFWGQRAKKQFQKRQNPVAQYQKTDNNQE